MRRTKIGQTGPWGTEKHGNTTVPIYRTAAGGGTVFVVVWSEGGERMRKSFRDEQKARAHAAKVAKHLASFGGTSLLLTGEQLLAYRRALDLLGNVPVDVAVREWKDARDKLREAGTRLEVPVAEVVAEMLDAKEKAGRSPLHVRDLRHRLGRFAAAFACPLSAVTADDVQAWLLGLRLSARSQNNFLISVRALVRFAERRRRIPKGAVDLSGIERAECPDSDVETYTPDELVRLLHAARRDFLPFVAIGALAGLRTAELVRLDWSEVTDQHITVSAHKAKTRARRLVPVCDALRALLEPYAGSEGRVVKMENIERMQAMTAKDAGVPRKKNGLRHSFGTYRLALTQNEAQTSLEMGNSPQMLFRHYRGLADKDTALRWFSVSL